MRTFAVAILLVAAVPLSVPPASADCVLVLCASVCNISVDFVCVNYSVTVGAAGVAGATHVHRTPQVNVSTNACVQPVGVCAEAAVLVCSLEVDYVCLKVVATVAGEELSLTIILDRAGAVHSVQVAGCLPVIDLCLGETVPIPRVEPLP
jgi:hypothetical protein